MSRQDLENQPVGSSQQADARHDAVQAKVAQKHPRESRFMTWFGSFRQHKPDQSADSRDRASNAGNGACEDENGRPTSKLAETVALIYGQVKLRRIKLEAKDGYTTHSFNSLARPIPVEDLFSSSRTLITLRLICRGIILFLAGCLFIGEISDWKWWFLTLVALAFQWMGIHGIGRVGIPTVQQLWSFNRYPQRFWEIIASKILFRVRAARLWWFVYLLISNMSDFEQNFLNAWSQRPISTLPSHNSEYDSRARTNESTERNNVSLDSRDIPDNEGMVEELSVHRSGRQHSDISEQVMVNGAISKPRGLVLIFVENEHLDIPILSDNMTDSALLEQLRMFYRYLKVKRGLVELIIPRSLVRIDCIKFEETTRMAGEVTGPLDCGRGLQFFHHPETATKAQVISNRVQKLPSATPHEGLEFIRTLDRNAIGGVIMAPPMASLVFVIVWLSMYLRKTKENDSKVDTQVVVTTAFTVASYLVTAGALITGLVAYLDSNTRESEASSKEK